MSGFAPEHEGAVPRASPNFGVRRGVDRPDAVVLHYTGMATGQLAEDRLCDPASEVSAHYVVHEDGRVVQLVAEAGRAWHAGRSLWAGQDDLNSRSIGVEVVNAGHGPDLSLGTPDYPSAQVDALVTLLRGILRRHGIAPARVLAHSDVSPGRKVDPGERFPWAVLARHGLALHVAPAPLGLVGPGLGPGDAGAAVRGLQGRLAQAGYGLAASGRFDDATAAVVAAFQRRHRPERVDGVADASTAVTLDRWLALLA